MHGIPVLMPRPTKEDFQGFRYIVMVDNKVVCHTDYVKTAERIAKTDGGRIFENEELQEKAYIPEGWDSV